MLTVDAIYLHAHVQALHVQYLCWISFCLPVRTPVRIVVWRHRTLTSADTSSVLHLPVWPSALGCCIWQVLVQWNVSTLHKAKTSPVSPSWVRDRRRNMEVPVSTVNLSCQSILASPMPLKWQSPHKMGLLSRVWWSHTCSWKASKITSPDVSIKCVFTLQSLSLGHAHLGLA